MEEPRFRPHTVLVMREEEVTELYKLPSRSDALDKATDLMLIDLNGRKTLVGRMESPRWYRVLPSDEAEEEL